MNSNTEFGFDFGSMKVTRTCSDEKGAHTISIETPKERVSIRATKTGNISFYNDKGEKLYLNVFNN